MLHWRYLIISLAGVTVSSWHSSSRGDVIIDFETFADGSTAAAGTSVTNQYSAFGVLFSGQNPVITSEPTQASSPPNILLASFPGQLIVADFTVPLVRIDVTAISVGFAGLDARALSADGTLLDSMTLVGSGTAPGKQDPISLVSSGPLIARVTFQQVSGSNVDLYGIDDLQFSPIPEPSSLLLVMVVVGLGGVASWFRQSRELNQPLLAGYPNATCARP